MASVDNVPAEGMRSEDLDDYGMLSELVQLSQKLKYQMIVLKRVTVNVQGGCKFPSAKLLRCACGHLL